MADRDKVIEGLKKVWNAFNSMEHELYADYVFDALELLKEQDEIIQRVLREKTDELNYKTTTMQIEIHNKEIRKVLEQK